MQPPRGQVAEFLAQHDAPLNAVRDHILTAGPIVWETKFARGHEAPLPNRRNFAASYQVEAWMIRHVPLRALERPFMDACVLDTAEQMRVWTDDLVKNGSCDLSPVHPMSMASWNLVGKVALAMRRGETPSVQTSCSDGTWLVSANEVKFSRDIAVPTPGIKYPLAYKR
jgi:hypothetical protein